MALNRPVLRSLLTMLGPSDVRRIEDNARAAEVIEQRWVARFNALFDKLAEDLLDTIAEHGEPRWPTDLAEQIGGLLLEHELATTMAASATITPAEYVRAAKGSAKPQPEQPAWPTDLARIRQLWDQWRRTGRLPGRTAEQARAVKTLYIRRVQQAWQREGVDFINGDRVDGYGAKGTDVNETGKRGRATVWNPSAFNRDAARVAIQKAFAVPRARAKTIVETETTRYYNTTRVNTYNQIDSVVAYLFVAVRDAATTKWCCYGKGGRHGVVFFKGSALLSRNCPPCHYNCRSELLPLSRLNPAHRKLLENTTLWAQNRKLTPLLPEWNRDRAA